MIERRTKVEIDKAITEALSENCYIIYRDSDYRELKKVAKIDREMQTIFNTNMNQIKNKSLQQQADAISKQMVADGKMSENAFKAIQGLSSGTYLESTMRQIADCFNSYLEKDVNRVDFDNVMKNVGDYRNMFAAGAASTSQLTSFFNLLVQGIRAMTNGKVSSNLFFELTQIGKELSGNGDFSFQGQSTAEAVSEQDLQAINEILSLMKAAAAQFTANGGQLTSDQFGAYITNIFSTTIAEHLSMNMLSNVLQTAQEEIEENFRKQGLKIVNPIYKRGSSVSQATSKVDLFNSDAFTFSIQMRDRSIVNIELGSNISSKWYQSVANNKPSTIHLVSSGNIDKIFKQFDRKVGNVMKNIVAHRWDDEIGYTGVRTVVASSFVTEWLAGTGTSTPIGPDTVQFIMINGKLYSVMDIVKRVVTKSLKYATRGSQPNLSFNGITALDTGVRNWRPMEEGDKEEWDAAWKRSNAVRDIINAITISATFNYNILQQYY